MKLKKRQVVLKSSLNYFFMLIIALVTTSSVSMGQSRTKLVTYVTCKDADACLGWYRHLNNQTKECGVTGDGVPFREGMAENIRSRGQLMMQVNFIGTPTQMDCILRTHKDGLVFYWGE